MGDVADTALQRYQQPFKFLIRHSVRTGVPPTRLTPPELPEVPIFRWAALVKAFAFTCCSNACQACAALLLLPFLHHLRFEQHLKTLKKFWNISLPKYSSFYDCRVLLTTLMATDFCRLGESPASTRHHHHADSEAVPRHWLSKGDARHPAPYRLLRQLSTQRQVGSSTLSCSVPPTG